MTPHFIEVNRQDLDRRRREVIERIGLPEHELRRRAHDHVATPDERDAWSEIEEIDFLLGDDEPSGR